jgi:hypothetical protein
MMCSPDLPVQLPTTRSAGERGWGRRTATWWRSPSGRMASRRRAPLRDHRMPRRLNRRVHGELDVLLGRGRAVHPLPGSHRPVDVQVVAVVREVGGELPGLVRIPRAPRPREAARRRVRPLAPGGQDPAVLRPGGAPVPQHAPPGLRLAPPPRPPGRLYARLLDVADRGGCGQTAPSATLRPAPGLTFLPLEGPFVEAEPGASSGPFRRTSVGTHLASGVR